MEERAALAERWLELTRVVLPAMAGPQHWPIRLDHCFMRACLNTVHLGQNCVHLSFMAGLNTLKIRLFGKFW